MFSFAPSPGGGPAARLGCAFLRGLAALALAAGAVIAKAGQPMLRATEVADRVWFVQGEAALGSPANRNFISNAAFVVTDDGVVVIDALGSPALAAELLTEIRRVTAQPLRYVVVTHYHADHVYGLQVLKAAGATVLAHPAGKEYLRSEAAQLRLAASREELAPWIDEQTRLVAADRWLEAEDTTLRVGSFSFLIRHAGPAHTPEDLVVYLPERGVLFAGDIVFRGRIPFVGQADSRQWIASLARLIELHPSLVVPGHGPVSREALADLELTRDYLVFLRKAMGAAAAELEPFDDAYAKTDWSRFEHMPLFRAANRMNAYNTYLLMEQQGQR
jgi:glyoxylase-like metal-dependent hydrolase (beta-lactamase superfamily II)